MLSDDWMKASYSGNEGSCVEARFAPGTDRGMVQIRDSKNPDGPALTLHPAALVALVDDIKAGNLHG